MLLRALCFLTLLLLSLEPSPPALAGDPLKGEALARNVCAECHFVLPDQESPSAEVPSFVDIAARHRNSGDLTRILTGPHPRMPDARLSPSEIEDIATYIRTLDSHGEENP